MRTFFSRSCLLAVLLACPGLAWPDSKPTVARRLAVGRIDAEQQRRSPKDGLVTGQNALAELWKVWKIKSELPTVDFTKELVLVATSMGSAMSMTPMLSESGDLTVTIVATADVTQDYGFQVVAVSRAGVKTYKGKPLPKD